MQLQEDRRRSVLIAKQPSLSDYMPGAMPNRCRSGNTNSCRQRAGVEGQGPHGVQAQPRLRHHPVFWLEYGDSRMGEWRSLFPGGKGLGLTGCSVSITVQSPGCTTTVCSLARNALHMLPVAQGVFCSRENSVSPQASEDSFVSVSYGI